MGENWEGECRGVGFCAVRSGVAKEQGQSGAHGVHAPHTLCTRVVRTLRGLAWPPDLSDITARRVPWFPLAPPSTALSPSLSPPRPSPGPPLTDMHVPRNTPRAPYLRRARWTQTHWTDCVAQLPQPPGRRRRRGACVATAARRSCLTARACRPRVCGTGPAASCGAAAAALGLVVAGVMVKWWWRGRRRLGAGLGEK